MSSSDNDKPKTSNVNIRTLLITSMITVITFNLSDIFKDIVTSDNNSLDPTTARLVFIVFMIIIITILLKNCNN